MRIARLTCVAAALALAAPVQAQRLEQAGIAPDSARHEAPAVIRQPSSADRKNGFIAFALAYTFPGLGHFYVGESHRGVVVLGTVAAGAMLAFAEAERSPGTAVVALSGAYVVYLWSMVDAPLAAKRHNRRLAREHTAALALKP